MHKLLGLEENLNIKNICFIFLDFITSIEFVYFSNIKTPSSIENFYIMGDILIPVSFYNMDIFLRKK